MARVNNLSNFLTDVASAIKTKKGSETNIPAANFDTEILALPSQGVYEQRVLNISANGTQTITPSSGYDAIDELALTVAVPEKQLQSKTYNFTQNTNIQLLPDSGYDGFDTVTLNINVPTIDTSDATATAEDLIEGTTAYVNGEKITGTLETTDAISIDNSTNTDTSLVLMDVGNIPSMIIDADINYLYGVRKIVEDGTGLEIIAPQSQIANVISLTADKIKKGETILEITGTYEGSEGGSGDVKLFKTVAEMQADPNPQEGDLAIVYRDELVPPSPGDTFRYFSPPATVVFDTPITTTTTLTIGTFMLRLNCTLTPTGFSASGRAATPASVTITYTSSDGVTYTKVAGEDDYDMGNQTISSSADVNILKFLPTKEKIFEGLYEYNSTQYVIADSQLDVTADYVYKKEFYGTNGVETGTLTTSVNNSFADVNAEVMSKIQKQYDNMTPRVLTDSDRTIDQGICIIPMKFDGTLLLDTSQVTNMSNMFYNCTSLVFVPLLNTSNVTNMNSMFSSCSSLVTISQLNTSSVVTMQNMFQGCSSLTSIPLLNTSNVTNVSYMFQGCSSLTSIPLLDTSNVTNIGNMFGGCTSLTTIPLLDTGNVTNMGAMFSGCSSLTTIPLLDTSKATSLIIMFNGCTSLSNESLNNILAMCANSAKITSNKTLKYVGLTSTQATTCQSLSNYSAFTAAGWTTGY